MLTAYTSCYVLSTYMLTTFHNLTLRAAERVALFAQNRFVRFLHFAHLMRFAHFARLT